MTIFRFAFGFMVRGIPIFDGLGAILIAWGMCSVALATFGALYIYCQRTWSTWGRGLEAERQVGDLIEHAIVQSGCAFAHDVKEALGGSGNVDHVVKTPAGIWTVETKSSRLPKRQFPQALAQVANNVCRVRHHLDTSLPVRRALVVADRWDSTFEQEHDWNGEPVMVFGPKAFWHLLRHERRDVSVSLSSPENERVERTVWNLGSRRYLDS